MAKGGGKRRTYVRDGNGRFASTPGGGKPALKGGTLAKRSSLKGSRAKLAAKDKADPSIRNALSTRAQKGAVTRGNKALRAAKVASQRAAVGRSKMGTISKGRRPPVMKATVLKPQAAMSGRKSGKALKGAKKALPAVKSTEPRPVQRQRTTVVPALQGSNKLAPLSPQRRKVANRAGARNSSLNELAIKAKEELKKAQNKAMPANNPYSDMTPKARKTALARLKKAEEADTKIRKSQMTTIRAKSFAEGMAGATKQGYTRYDNAVRRSDIRTPKAKPPNPLARTKGSRTTLPRTPSTVAKPKGLKPSPVSKEAAKPMKAAVQFRSRKQAAKAYKLKTNTLGNKTAASIGFNAAIERRDAFANSAPRLVFRRGKNQQITLSGGVETVRTGKMKQVGYRNTRGAVRMPLQSRRRKSKK